MHRVVVVTDSAADLSAEEAKAYGVEVVPLRLVVDGRTYDDSGPGAAARWARVLRQGVPVTTSRPSPAAFLAVYRALAKAGATAVVSVHLSGELSSTRDAARSAGSEAPVPTTVVDSRQVTMGLGFAVLAAAATAGRGAAADDVAEAARRRAARTSTWFSVDGVDHLRRGGRLGPALPRPASRLAARHLLHLDSGRIAPLRTVRTQAQARAELEELATRRIQELGGVDAAEVAVHHLAAADGANALADRLRVRMPGLPVRVRETGAAVGAHVGPGLLAAVVAPVETAVREHPFSSTTGGEPA